MVYKRTLLVQNILGNQDSPLINTLGSLDSLVYYSPESFLITCSDACSKYTKKPGVFLTGGVETPQCIHNQGFETPRCIHHRGVETCRCIHHQGVILESGESFYRF